jgi:hypothetical protein
VSTDAEQQQPVFVLKLETVRWAIQELQDKRIHPFFLAYLHLRQQSAAQGTVDDIAPDWEELAKYLPVEGGPPNKPYYRPFWNGGGTDPGRYWLNRNLAGSFSPSSLREVPKKVVEGRGSHFALRADHAQLAREHLLYDTPISALAMAAYLYRDFGLVSEREPDLFSLETVFRRDFHFAEPNDPDFDALFVLAAPSDLPPSFEPLGRDTVGVE